jgi:hypothetical protein
LVVEVEARIADLAIQIDHRPASAVAKCLRK